MEYLTGYLILSLFLEVPRVIGAIVAFYVGRWAGKTSLKSGASIWSSFVLAASIFIIVDFLAFIAWRPEWDLIEKAASGASYYYYLIFVPKILGILFMRFSLSKTVVAPEQNQPTSSIVKLKMVFMIVALLTIFYSLYTAFSTYQVIDQGNKKVQEFLLKQNMSR